MDATDMDEFQQPVAPQQFSIRRVFLATLITSLSISALITIFIFLLGDFGDTEVKLLFTTLAIGGCSLTGLCSSVLYDRREYIPLAFLGLFSSIVGFLIAFGIIWEMITLNDYWKWMMVFVILALSAAHSSLLLLVRSDKNIVNMALKTTITFIVIIALMLIYLVMSENSYIGDSFYRLLGVFAVLDVLGTIITPVLKKLK